MTSLYVTSPGSGAGKTALGIGLGRWLQSKGLKVGYFKPVSASVETGAADADAEFAREALGLKEAAQSLSAVAAPPQNLEQGMDRGVLERMRQAYKEVSQGKDLVVVEGPSGVTGLSQQIARLLQARVLLVVRYDVALTAEQIVSAAEHFKGSLLGIVLNAVPVNRLAPLRAQMVPALQSQGIKVLGLLPEDRALLTLTVAELARHLGGEVLNRAEATGELVEHIMVGAMCLDPGPLYFGRKANKAVVTRGDRPDIQMAALETPTRCIVLSGGTQPVPVVRQRADMRNVALVLVKTDTLSTVASIEGVFPAIRFRQPRKLGKIEVMLRENLDLETVKKELGIKG